MQNLTKHTASSPSREISQNSPPVPDQQTAAILSSLIDRARAAVGWNRLPENEQDISIITWYEILFDAGVPIQHYTACYRSAQQRKSELLKQGKERSIVTPNDIAVEWEKIKDLHFEIDKTHLLAENAAAACQRCFGTNKEEMPDGSIKDDCSHKPLTGEEKAERAQAKAKQIEFMRDAMKKIGKPKPVETVEKPKRIILKCSACGRRDWKDAGWEIGEQCRDMGSGVECTGQMQVSI